MADSKAGLIKPILLEGHSVLRQKALPVGERDIPGNPIVPKLHATLLAYRAQTGFGRAISAPQIGESIQLIVLDLGAGPIALFNPEITWVSTAKHRVWDDCLSVPDKIVAVERFLSISVRYLDSRGHSCHWQHLPADMAELIQHEMDHLQGILMIDHALELRPIAERAKIFANSRRQTRLTVEHVLEATNLALPEFQHSPQFLHEGLSEKAGCQVVVKVETLNPLRSFKGRGASYFFAKRLSELRQRPLVTASAGNWGQALAYMCRRQGLGLKVFASVHANPHKLQAMRRLGAEVRLVGQDFDAAKAAAKAYAEEVNGWFLEDGAIPEVTEGHGTLVLELLGNHAKDSSIHPGQPLDAIVAPLGNGALLNGVGLYAKAWQPHVQVIGVCAEGAPSMREAWLGRFDAQKQEKADTFADGIAVRVPIQVAVEDMHGLVDEVLLVSDSHIQTAMDLALQELGLILEPAGAASLATLFAYPERFKKRRVAVILTGSFSCD